MSTELIELLLEYLPGSIGVIIIVSSAGIMGLFKSVALGKKSYDSTLDSLERQISVFQNEASLLRKHNKDLEITIDCYRTQVNELKNRLRKEKTK